MRGTDPRHRYILYRRLTEGPIRTFVGRGPAGDRVMVHFLSGPPSRSQIFLERLDGMPKTGRQRIRTVENVDGEPVVISDYLDGFQSFDSWLETLSPRTEGASARDAAEPAEQAVAPSQAPESPGAQPGEFTRLFQLGQGALSPDGPGEAPHPQSADAGNDESPEREPSANEPGEFTRLFLGADSVREPVAPALSAEAAGDEPHRESRPVPDPGTPSSGSDAEPSSPERPHTEPARPEDASSELPRPEDAGGELPRPEGRSPRPEGPGEFTRLFAGGGPRTGERTVPDWSDAALDAGGRQGDEYLQRLGDPTAGLPPEGAAGAPADPELPPEGAAGAPADPEPPPDVPEAPPYPSKPSGPSLYTRTLRGADPGPAPDAHGDRWNAPPSLPSSPPVPPKTLPPTSRRPYAIALGIIALLTIALIVFFALRGEGDGPDAADQPATPEETITPPEAEG